MMVRVRLCAELHVGVCAQIFYATTHACTHAHKIMLAPRLTYTQATALVNTHRASGVTEWEAVGWHLSELGDSEQ